MLDDLFSVEPSLTVGLAMDLFLELFRFSRPLTLRRVRVSVGISRIIQGIWSGPLFVGSSGTRML